MNTGRRAANDRGNDRRNGAAANRANANANAVAGAAAALFENSLPAARAGGGGANGGGGGGRRLPLSGSEETFTDLVYGTRRGKDNNNCYGYAIDEYRNSGATKLQPGNVSRSPGEMSLGSCASLRRRTLADLKGRAYAVDPARACRPGHYKVMAFLAPGNDYHWYKQHKDALVRLPGRLRDLAALARALDVRPSQLVSASPSPRAGDLVLVKDAGLWSHKQGFATGPLLKDSCGKAITDPRTACRTYPGGLDYRDFCGAFCVKRR